MSELSRSAVRFHVESSLGPNRQFDSSANVVVAMRATSQDKGIRGGPESLNVSTHLNLPAQVSRGTRHPSGGFWQFSSAQGAVTL